MVEGALQLLMSGSVSGFVAELSQELLRQKGCSVAQLKRLLQRTGFNIVGVKHMTLMESLLVARAA